MITAKVKIQKALAGADDLLFGQGTVEQVRRGELLNITKVNAALIPFSGDTATNNFVSIVEQFENVAADIAARISADEVLQNNITAEATNRAQADATLQSNIDAEAATRLTATTLLQSNIGAETLARITRDSELTGMIVSNYSSLDSRVASNSSSITSITTVLSGDVILRYPNYNLIDIAFPWDLGSIADGVSAFSNENIPQRRVSLSQGATTTDLGMLA